MTIACLELVARDVYDLFRLFQDKLIIVTETPAILEGLNEAEASSVLASLQASYKAFYPRVQDFLDQTADLLAMYGFKIKTKLEPFHDFDSPSDDKGAGGDDDEAAGDLPPSPEVSTIDVEVTPTSSSSSSGGSAAFTTSSAGRRKSGVRKLQGESGIEEGTVDDHLTPYDDSTPYEKPSLSGRAPPPSSRRKPPRVVEEDEEQDGDAEEWE